MKIDSCKNDSSSVALTLVLAGVVNYTIRLTPKLWCLTIINYNHNMFIVQATDNVIKLF